MREPRRSVEAPAPDGRALSFTRREFLTAAVGATVAASACRRAPARSFDGALLGPSLDRGHAFRKGLERIRTPATRRRTVVVGGGISGLAAAWRLVRAGDRDVTVLELERTAGGTSAHGDGHPWGAHYVPVPDRHNRALVQLLTEVGAITGTHADGRPVFAEEMLCRAPQERLFLGGRWQEGLYPKTGATPADLAELDRFHRDVAAFARARDGSGRAAFVIPIEYSSPEPEWTALDKVSMAAWMDARGYRSRRLRWFVDYACRDDYGLRLDETSAWAAIHYYASRLGEDEHAAEVLTWPEGNGRVADHLASVAGEGLRTGVLVTAIDPGPDTVRVEAIDREGVAFALEADRVVVAVPKFVARHVVVPWRTAPPSHLAAFTNSSWVVANLHLSNRPRSKGFPLAWDNVLYDSNSLGYVVASHQAGRDHGPSIWTWYLPICGTDPAGTREQLLTADWNHWADAVTSDLARAHPDLLEHLTRLDVWRWGHAMVRPTPGLLWSGAREAASRADGRLHFAHTDTSGVALLEEALHHGVRAAEEILAARGEKFVSLL